MKLLRRYPQVLGLVGVLFLMSLAHMVYPTTFVLYADYRFHWGPQMVGYTLALVGILAAIVQGGLIKKIVGWLGERRALMFGLGCGTVGFALYGVAPNGWWFWAAMPVAALWGVSNPAAQAIMTHQVDPREQGRLQGAVASLSSVAGIIAPTHLHPRFRRGNASAMAWRGRRRDVFPRRCHGRYGVAAGLARDGAHAVLDDVAGRCGSSGRNRGRRSQRRASGSAHRGAAHTMSIRRDVLKASALGALGLAIPTMIRRALAARVPKAPRPLRILILGGTGFIGPHQVRYALARGHKLTLFNRGKNPQAWPGAVEELVGDRNTGDLESLAGREWDVCIDNPTTLPFWVRDAGKALSGKVKQYIFISTMSVYADDSKPSADENAALAAYRGKDAMAETQASLKADLEHLYGPLKAQSEREAEKQFPGITTIIRPGLIAGPGDETDRFTYWPVRLARGGDVLAPGDGKDPVQFIDARDLAEWTIRMAEQRAFGIYNAFGPARELSMAAMLGGIAGAIHAEAKPVWIPADFLAQQHVSPWSDMPVWLPMQGDSAGFARRVNRRAVTAGLTFRSLATTARDTLTWFHEQTPARQAKLRAGLSAEREKNVLAAWKAARTK